MNTLTYYGQVISFGLCLGIGIGGLLVLFGLAWMKAWDCIFTAMRVHKLACQFMFSEERKRNAND